MNKRIVFFLLIFILGGLATFLLFTSSRQEVKSTGDNAQSSLSVLWCKGTEIIDPFFPTKKAEKFYHEIKIIYDRDAAKSISYGYMGEYKDNTTASLDDAEMHAKYNIYMGGNGINAERLNPTFLAVDNTMKISLYTDINQIQAEVLPIFLLDNASLSASTSHEHMTKHYEARGFKCKYN